LTATNREAAISKTLTYEGGFCNDPRDPGGATNWGITIIDARKHWKPDATVADVKSLPKAVAIEIYRQKYWAVLDCDSRPSGPDFVDFDYGVNSGTGRVTKLRAVLDPQKLAPIAYVKAACSARSSFLHALQTYATFGVGWSKRVADVEATGIRMAAGATGNPVAPVIQKEATAANKKVIAHSTAAASTATTVPSLPTFPHADLSSKVGLVCLGIGAVLLVAVFAWHAYHNSNRAAALKAAL